MASNNEDIPPIPVPPVEQAPGVPIAPAAPPEPLAPPAPHYGPPAGGGSNPPPYLPAGAPAGAAGPPNPYAPASPYAPAGTQPYGTAGDAAPNPYATPAKGAQNPYATPAAYTPIQAGQPQGLSIASLVCGIVSLLGALAALGLFPAIAAIITGHLAQRRQPQSRGLWLTGLITGYLGLGIWLLTVLGFVLLGIFAGSTSTDYGSPT